VYDSYGVNVSSDDYNRSLSNGYSVSWSVTSGQTYYIRVINSWSVGTYQIAFNSSSTPPPITLTLPTTAIQLTANTWANGNITTSGGVQWFKFIANSSPQYIHVSFGTLNDLDVLVCDSSGVTVGSETNLYGTTTYISRPVTSGQTYYIRVRPYYSYSGGTYRIAFNSSSTPPP